MFLPCLISIVRNLIPVIHDLDCYGKCGNASNALCIPVTAVRPLICPLASGIYVIKYRTDAKSFAKFLLEKEK